MEKETIRMPDPLANLRTAPSATGRLSSSTPNLSNTPKAAEEINVLDDVVNAPPSSSDKLDSIINTATRLQNIEEDITKCEAYLKELKAEGLRIATQDLPDALAAINLNDFKMTNGYSIVVKPFVNASLPSKEAIEKAKSDEERQELILRKQAAFAYLKDHNAESLIKTVVKVDFAKGASIDGLMAMLKRWTKLVKNASYDETVHNATLVSYAKEQLEAGTPLPEDVFAIHVGRMAKVIPPPKPKK